jgi:hypothetical protein
MINLGLNDTGSFEVTLIIRNSYGLVVLWDLKSAGSLSSLQKQNLTWQWSTHLSGQYTISIDTGILDDEIPGNNMISEQVVVYFKFFEDDAESGASDWTSSASSLSPLWHLTNLESYSPAVSDLNCGGSYRGNLGILNILS